VPTVTIPNDWRARALLAESEEERLRVENEQLQTELRECQKALGIAEELL